MTIEIDKFKKQEQERKLQDIQANTQSQTQIVQASEQMKQQTMQMELQGKGQLQQLVNQGEIEKENVRGQNDRETLQMKLQGEMQIAQLNGQITMGKFNELEDRKDDRTRLQATQQSELIDQRAKDKAPKDFEAEKIDTSMFELEA